MEVQKELFRLQENESIKASVEKQLQNLSDHDEINFGALPYEIGNSLKNKVIKELTEEARFLGQQITETNMWLDGCIAEADKQEKIEAQK